MSVVPAGDFLPMSRLTFRSHLPDLLRQAIAPGVLTLCCDIPLQALPETVLKKRQAPHLVQKSSRQLAPCLRLCCSALFVMCLVLISPSHPPSPALLILLSSPQATPNRFFLLRALRVSSLHRIFFTASHSASCRLTSSASHLLALFVYAGG